ncbi:hypothetical protein BpHYR1_030255 [Brachionus plicatilis]|uniref:Uncharacterized protein n=1 Tax=Brachionus plicatilis TaxID=10195 RepID=A0A3M7P5J9_BRAPC|nr:hypothetical protein BpHYR1_030255 [Brachionus plicatilis]
MVKAQNHLKTDFHYLEENRTLENESEKTEVKKEQPESNHYSKSTSQSSLSTKTEGTQQEQPIIEPDMTATEKRVFNRRSQFRMEEIPKLLGNEKDKIEEWIYLVETEVEGQGIDKNRLVTTVNQFLKGNALQLVRNLRKKIENLVNNINAVVVASHSGDETLKASL